jgi:hypothetical protein
MASFGGMNGQSMMPMCIHWYDDKKNRMGFSVSDRFKFCIQSLAELDGFKEKFQVTGYTTCKAYEKNCMQPVIYFATKYVSGSKRYDYAMVQFENDDGSITTCPAKIIGFACYNKTPGIPTPHFC